MALSSRVERFVARDSLFFDEIKQNISNNISYVGLTFLLSCATSGSLYCGAKVTGVTYAKFLTLKSGKMKLQNTTWLVPALQLLLGELLREITARITVSDSRGSTQTT